MLCIGHKTVCRPSSSYNELHTFPSNTCNGSKPGCETRDFSSCDRPFYSKCSSSELSLSHSLTIPFVFPSLSLSAFSTILSHSNAVVLQPGSPEIAEAPFPEASDSIVVSFSGCCYQTPVGDMLLSTSALM